MSEHFTLEDVIPSQAERFAIQKANECGPRLASLHPQIVEDARNISLAEIARRYDVATMFGVTETIALSIAKRAIQTLLSKEEREKLYSPRLFKTKQEVGTRTFKEGVGLFGMTDAEHSKVGKKVGEANRDKRRGIFKITDPEAFRVAASEAGKKAQEVGRRDTWFRGEKIDGMDEGTYAQHLASLPEYQLSSGLFTGAPDYTKITGAVNARYGMGRSRSATKGFFENVKARKKKNSPRPKTA